MHHGNAVRQGSCDNSLGAVGAIVTAIDQGCYYIISWTTVPVIIMFAFLIPLIYKIIKKSEIKFRFPLIFSILTFGIFCAQFVPPLYAMNNLGGSRLIDIIYYSFYWLIGLNLVYYLGWINNKFGEIKLLDYINDKILFFSFIILILFGVTMFVTKQYKSTTSYISYNSLKSGEAQEYYEQILERYEIYKDENTKNVILKEVTVKPIQLYGADLTTDKDHWINKDVSRYFEKESIVLEEEK